MKPQSKTDWERVKREAAADAPLPHDPEADLYDPNDAAVVAAFWKQSTVRRPGGHHPPPGGVEKGSRRRHSIRISG